MSAVMPPIAWAWPSLPTVVGVLVALWCAFWIYVWFTYLPIVVRLIGEAPLLVPEPSTPPTDGGEECEFRTADGLTLRGTYLKTPSNRRRGVILFGHELNGDRWNAVPYVTELSAEGYDVLTFDMRNHGTSDADPRIAPRPWITTYDVVDMRAAVDYLAARSDADPRGIGVLGISRGGGAALCAAADDPRIRCIFTDGAYPSHTTHLLYLKRYVEIYVPRGWHWLSRSLPDGVYRIFLAAARYLWGRRNRYPFIHVERSAGRVRQPVLLIHGGRDTMIPAEAARILRSKLAGPSKLWIVAEARHNGAVFCQPEKYRRRVLKFFRLHLAPRDAERRAADPTVVDAARR